jgi:sulfofructose kinase
MTARPPTVTCVGISIQDTVFSVDRALQPGAKNLASSLCVRGGGPAANAAVAIAALGGNARLVSNLGADAIGEAIIEDLVRFGVDVAGVRQLDGVPSPQSSVAVDGTGERTILNHTDDRIIDSSRPVTTAEIDQSDAVVVDLRWPHGARSAIDAANALGVPSIVDFDLTTTETPADILESASHVIFSRPALVTLTGTANIDRALHQVAATSDAFVAVTLGGRGVKWVEDDAIHMLPSLPVAVVDTLGAGDVFHGAFAFGIAVGQSSPQALRFGSAASALKCSRPGGRDGFPSRTEVEALLEYGSILG